jgi:putative sigma-54 modulation protein
MPQTAAADIRRLKHPSDAANSPASFLFRSPRRCGWSNPVIQPAFLPRRVRAGAGKIPTAATPMKSDLIPSLSPHRSNLLLRGIHVWLTDAMKAALESKAERLFRHEPRILRLRIDVERDLRGPMRVFTAKGRIEIAGPDLTASVTTSDAYTSINLLIDKLDRMLRKRMTTVLRRRASGDIREHAPRPALA